MHFLDRQPKSKFNIENMNMKFNIEAQMYTFWEYDLMIYFPCFVFNTFLINTCI